MDQPSAPVHNRGASEKFAFKEIDIDCDYMNNTVVHQRNLKQFAPYVRERDEIGCLVAADKLMAARTASNVSELSLKDKIEMAASKKRKDPMKLTT